MTMIRRFSHQIRTTSEWSARGWHERWSAPRSESSAKGSLIVTVAYIPQQSRQQAKPALDLGDRDPCPTVVTRRGKRCDHRALSPFRQLSCSFASMVLALSVYLEHNIAPPIRKYLQTCSSLTTPPLPPPPPPLVIIPPLAPHRLWPPAQKDDRLVRRLRPI